MEEFPELSELLEAPAGDTAEALVRVVARHRQRRARRLKMAAATGVVVLAAGLGIGLSQAGGPPSSQVAAGPNEAAVGALPAAGSFSYKRLSPPLSESGSSETFASAQLPANGGLVCSVLGCGEPLSPLRPVGVEHVGSLAITAFVVSPGDVKGGSSAIGALSPLRVAPRICDGEKAVTIIVRQDNRWLATAVVPLAGGAAREPIAQLSESAVATAGSGKTLLVMTARVSTEVASVRAKLAGGPTLSARPKDGLVLLARLVPPAHANGGASLRVFSPAGRAIEQARIPSPSLVGIPLGACPLPNG